MRKYRGMTKEGKWVYGWYVENWNHGVLSDATGSYIIDKFGTWHIVLPETVGQSTGLKDKNGKGKECYEDDLMQLTHISFADCCLTKVIRDHKGRWSLEHEGRILCSLYDGIYQHNGEVIGDIHTMPEKMEASDEA